MAKQNVLKNTEEGITTRHYVRVVAFVVFSASLVVLLIREVYPYLRIESTTHSELGITTEDTTPSKSDGLSREFPTELRIPKLSLSVPFETPLGLNDDGAIEVPKQYDTVGWYKLGAAPGEVGTASILGHVDSYMGAAVFYHLGKLEPGDRIYVTRADGSVATFEVEYLERYAQSEFPTEKVFGMTDYPSLRLITCSGEYDKGALRYTHNTVIFARFVAE